MARRTEHLDGDGQIKPMNSLTETTLAVINTSFPCCKDALVGCFLRRPRVRSTPLRAMRQTSSHEDLRSFLVIICRLRSSAPPFDTRCQTPT